MICDPWAFGQFLFVLLSLSLSLSLPRLFIVPLSPWPWSISLHCLGARIAFRSESRPSVLGNSIISLIFFPLLYFVFSISLWGYWTAWSNPLFFLSFLFYLLFLYNFFKNFTFGRILSIFYSNAYMSVSAIMVFIPKCPLLLLITFIVVIPLL